LASPTLNVLVIGATGSIGVHVVARARALGHKVRILLRDKAQASQFPADVEVVIGDLTAPGALAAAVDGIDAVVFTQGTYGSKAAAEAVDYGGVANVLASLDDEQVRIALMTTVAVTDRKGAHDWKRRAERLVRASGHPYTIVRPGWFDYNRGDQLSLVMRQGDKRQSGTASDGVISRSQLAEVLVASLTSEAARNKTLELDSAPGNRTRDLNALFDKLEIDPPGALDGVLDAANMPLEDEPGMIARALTAFRRRAGQLT
jgi:uncharacterized protein YbjT (DUF2867 family)